MDPGTAAIIASLVSAAGSVGGGFLSGRSSQPKETKMQKKQRKVVDELLASLKGEGPYSDLFRTDEAAFQKSFVDPVKSIYANQIAPQIQQKYIASGMQRGSALQDQLLRAGVDLDQLINQQYMDYIQQAQNRQANAFSNILGLPAGAQSPRSSGDILGQAASGYISSDQFGKDIEGILKYFSTDTAEPPRKGFTRAYDSPVNTVPGGYYAT